MQDKMNKIHNTDCLTFMRTVPDNYFDLVLTDPPYGINADVKQNANAGKKGGKKGGVYKKYKETEWDTDIPSQEVFNEAFTRRCQLRNLFNHCHTFRQRNQDSCVTLECF